MGLAFGDAVPTGVAGTITIATGGGRTAVDIDLMGGTISAAGFTVGGESGTNYTITLPASATLSGAGLDMTVDTFTDDSSGMSLCGCPFDDFNVGATLHVGASQAPGVYSGTFSVTAEYN